MKNLRFYTFILVSITISLFFSSASAQKMTAEDVVAKHLDSIGTAETRKNLKNLVNTGLVQYTVLRQGGAGGNGKIVLASEGNKTLLGMTFALPTYPAETVVFDGKKLKVAYAYSNVRSYLGDYLYRYDDVIKEGLLGGTLSTAWSLGALSDRKAKVEFEGTKKVDDKEAYVLSYLPKGGSDLQIKMYFDANNFEHLRTEYRRIISSQAGGGIGSPSLNQGANSADASSQQREQRQILIEDFSKYKKENGVNLPHAYRIYVMLDGAAGTREYEWKAEFSQFFFNQPLDPGSFNTSSK